MSGKYECIINMENQVNKFYTSYDISIATFIGGPLATGYLIYKNYKILENEEAARYSMILGILLTFILLAIMVYIPFSAIEKIPRQLIPFINSGIALLVVEKTQGKRIKEHIASGGKKESIWKAIGLSLVGTVVTIIMAFPILFYQTSHEGKEMSFSDGKYKIFYEENIPEADVNKIGIYLLEAGLFAGENKIELEIRKIINGYHLYIPINEEYWNDKDVIRDLEYTKRYIETKLINKTIYIIMVHYGIFSYKVKQLK